MENCGLMESQTNVRNNWEQDAQLEWSTLHVDTQTLRGYVPTADLQVTKGVLSDEYLGFARAGDCAGRSSARGVLSLLPTISTSLVICLFL